jgi:hypothetical protein
MTTSPVKTYRKAVVERRRLYLDYSCWLEDAEVLTDTQVTVVPYTETAPIVVTSGYVDADHKKLVMFVSGGIANTNYTISMVVRTDAGQVKQDNIGLRVT